ncbi:MAG TPA: hypothetical protein VH575_15710 [Gemmataceae bacterium]
MNISGDRLFPIRKYDYATGLCDDGRQVVMGLLCPHLVAYFFDPQGNLLAKESRPWDHPAPTMGANGPYRIYDTEFQAALDRQLRGWQAEIGFRPGTIRVKAFLDEEEPVGIELLPEHYRDIDPVAEYPDEEDRREFLKARDQWVRQGKFVWWWAKDYFMSRDGKVEST